MNLQVLVATMHQSDHSLLKKMNIQSDAIIGNQCEKNEIEEFVYNGYNIKYLSFAERGVSLNRNNTLMRATADICLFADDDMVYVDGYDKQILQVFEKFSDADVIVFNLFEDPIERFVIKKFFKVNSFRYMRFGTARIAFRKNSITKNGLSFNLHFGGGSKYGAGEDVLFLHDCLKKKLKIIAAPIFIARLTNERESSWFKGYTDKYFIDKGALFSCLSKHWSKLLCLQFALRHKDMFKTEKSIKEAYDLMIKGTMKFELNQ